MVEGERILGRFTVCERIGAGGAGAVHRAWDERLHRPVAVKEVVGSAAGRILREAHAAARLNHPAIITLYELGEQAGRAYLVSELIEGLNLRELALAGGLSDRDVADIGAELCAALEHAHAAGIIHRDIKPENVIASYPSGITSDGRRPAASGAGLTGQVHLADFGVARILDEGRLTETGQAVGTLAYMSPEQASGAEPDPATDLYSLGLTLYELWTGANPVAAGTPAATARAIGEPVPPLAEVRPELPASLSAAIDSCLDPDPERRPAAGELHEALLDARGSLHPERPVPEPAGTEAGSRPARVGARPIAVLSAAGAVAGLGILAGLPGLALVLTALLAPAALLLARPREWMVPATSPALGVLGMAPAFIVAAALHPRPGARAALAGLGWAWTGILGAIAGASLGVTPAGDPGSWATAVPDAVAGVLAPLAGIEPLSAGLVWVGAAVLLGAVLDAASPALAAVLAMVWAAVLIAALGAIGGPAAPGVLLVPGLLAILALAVWDRAGRPELARVRELALAPASPARPDPAPDDRRAPRQRATDPLADGETRAARTARRHVAAALHGAGRR